MVKSKSKKRRAKPSLRENGDVQITTMAVEGDDTAVTVASPNGGEEGDGEDGGARGYGEDSAPALSAGSLKKKQRWEQKVLKTKVDALRKQRQKLNKKNPEQNAARKEVLQQLKTLVAEQAESHKEERKKLELARQALEGVESSDLQVNGLQDGVTLVRMSRGVELESETKGGNEVETMDCDVNLGLIIGGRLKKAMKKNNHRGGATCKKIKNQIARKVGGKNEKRR